MKTAINSLTPKANHVDQCPAIENNNGGRYTKIG